MSSTSTNRVLASSAGILLVLGIVVFGGIALSRASLRLDVTQEKLYTLNEGTKAVLAGVDGNVTFKFYFSRSMEGVSPQLKNYANQVERLLEQYVDRSRHLSLEKIDPEPDSPQEEEAQKYGIQGMPVAPGINIYFGLVVSGAAADEVIPVFDEGRERFLEYDITRAIHMVTRGGKVKVGVLSGLKVMGDQAPANPFGMPQEGQAKPWLFIEELRQTYEVVGIEESADEVPADVDVLLVVQPKVLSEKMLYAVDQFVLSGRNAVFFVDPFYMGDERMNRFGAPPSEGCPADRLLKAWGVQYKADSVVLDPLRASQVRTQQGVVKHPAWLTLTDQAMNQQEIISAQLNHLLMVDAGVLAKKDGVEGVAFAPLVSTSARAKAEDRFKIMYGQPKDLMKDLDKEGQSLALAGIFRGRFKSAFDKAPEGAKAAGPHRAQADKEGALVVVGDVDMLENDYCLRPINFFGQVAGYQPLNQNTVFLNNVVEMMANSTDLISLRSRGSSLRPFVKVQEMEENAKRKWQDKEDKLSGELKDLQAKIDGMMKEADPGQKTIVSGKIQGELKKFYARRIEINRELREVRKNLRADIEALGTTLKLVNILAMPLLIGVLGIIITIQRGRRLRHEQ